jgi:hypothetical protein
LSSRFSDLEAPVLIALDLVALREEPLLMRFADAFASWGSITWSQEAGGTPRRAALVGEPLPPASEATFRPRGMLRQHRGDGALDALLASPAPSPSPSPARSPSPVVTRLIAPRISASILGDSDVFDRVLERPSTLRPAWSRALTDALRSDAAISLVADGPWCVDRIKAFAGDDGGRIFVGKVYAMLTLRDDPEMPRIFAEATESIQSVAVTAGPAGNTIRATIALTFAGAADADRAAPHWRLFLFRLSDWAPGTRGLDVQCADERLILRVDLPLAALVDWIDERLAIPGSRSSNRRDQ